MYKRIFVILALAFALFVTECWGAAKTSSRPAVLSAAQTGCGGIEQPPCPPPSITNTFSPGTPRGVYDFTTTGDGILVVQFDTVLAPGFSLTVTVNHSLDPLDPNVRSEERRVGKEC